MDEGVNKHKTSDNFIGKCCNETPNFTKKINRMFFLVIYKLCDCVDVSKWCHIYILETSPASPT